MNIGDEIILPDGHTGVLIRLQNAVATVVVQLPTGTIQIAFNESDLKPVHK